MTKFLDIADEGQVGTAPLRGKQVDVVGLSARQIARLLVQHEQAAKVLTGGTEVNLFELIKLAPEAVCACIAYGTGYDDQPEYGGDKAKFDQAVTRAHKLTAGEQVDIIMGILDATFGKRLNPFVSKLLDKLVASAGAGGGAPRQGRPPNPKTLSRQSLKQLRDSLLSTTTPEEFGVTHQGNSPATPS